MFAPFDYSHLFYKRVYFSINVIHYRLKPKRGNIKKTSVVVFSLMLISLFSCVSGGDLGGMVQVLREADQANNPKDETGNYLARINDPNIRFTPGGNFFSTMTMMDGDGISKIEFKQVPASVYVMSENNLLRYPN